MPRKDITPILLKKLYIDNLLSKKEIALKLKCNITTIHEKMEKFGIPARKPIEAVRIAMKKKIIIISKGQLKNLYLDHKLPVAKIAKKMGFCQETIKRELERYKISLRTQKEVAILRGEKIRIPKSIIERLYFRHRLTQKEIAEKLSRHRGSILRLMKRYGLKTRPKSIYVISYPKFDFSNDLEEKAYLIGFRLGDLYAASSPTKNSIIVGTTSTKIAQINLFKKLFRKYGKIWISKPRKDGNKTLVVRLNYTFQFLLPKEDNTPKWIRENDNYFLSFLAGYSDAEGCIHIDKNNVSRFQLASYDRNILKQIYEGLIKIGVECKPPRISVRKGHIKSDGLVYRNDHWCFTINKKSSLLLFLQFLKPRLKHQKRLHDLVKAEKNIIERNQKVRREKNSFKY